MTYQGTVVSFKTAFGFMFCAGLNRRVFFHVADLHGPDPKVGDLLEFELAPSRTPGKPEQAANVRPVAGIVALKAVV